jgi:hypothetical protein
MILPRRLMLACASGLLLAPFAALAQPADQANTTPAPAETPAPQPEGETASDDAAGQDKAEDSKRVCRSVRADPSSRRKTRVCRTVEEWRQLNVPL